MPHRIHNIHRIYLKNLSFLVMCACCFGCTAGSALKALESTSPLVDERPALPFPPGVNLESVCGLVDDLQHVELYDGSLGVDKSYVNEYEKSTVQFQWKNREEIRSVLGPKGDAGNVSSERWCTGTLFQVIGGSGVKTDYVLTAAHCFAPQMSGWFTPQSNEGYLPPEKNAELMVINLNYQVNGDKGDVREVSEYDVLSLVENGMGGLDYAIVKLGSFRNGNADYVKRYAQLQARALKDAESLTIIQHPQGEPKKIESGTHSITTGASVYYSNIDTHGGSSGSGVRDRNGNVVAVHTNGGCSRTDGANKGVLLRAISDVSHIL